MPGESSGRPRIVRWVGIFFFACFIGMIPWTVFLWLTLPVREVSPHYNLAWTGFDVLLAVVLLGTGGCVIARSGYLAVTATSAATLLVVDAWFDITTSPAGADLFWALVMAAVAELPLAVACGWLAHHTEHLCQGKIDLFLGHTKRWR
ncbi:MAG TPA: hypothetical protein VHZ03_12170 [Trebonia sp.]|nr:hypothetical protein [Trebonia sp.]